MLLCSSGSGTTSAERGSGVRGGDVGGCIVFGPDARKDERRKGAEAGRERRKEQAAAITTAAIGPMPNRQGANLAKRACGSIWSPLVGGTPAEIGDPWENDLI